MKYDVGKKTSKVCLVFTKQKAVVFSCILFLVYRILFLIAHEGYFSFDEFYHISTLNPSFSTNYDRANYINYMAKAICSLFGVDDPVVKLIPLIMGTISFLCALYLMYHIYENPYWVTTISSVLIFLPLIMHNHFYIRMYVFLEALVMVNCTLFYLAEKSKNKIDRIIYLAFTELLAIAYYRNTTDFSAKAILILTSFVVAYCLGRGMAARLFQKHLLVKIIMAIFAVCVGIAAIYTVAAKQHWIKSSIFEDDRISLLKGMNNILTFYRTTSPVFLQYVYVKLFFVSVPFILSMVYVWRKKVEDKKALYVIAALPLAGYSVVLYDNYLLRTFASFLPIICVLSLYFLDQFKLSRVQHLAIIIVVILLSVSTQKGFWENPSIRSETNVEGVGRAVALAREYEQEGYEVVPMMSYVTQSAYFDLLDASINLNLEDTREKKENRDENGKTRGNDEIIPIIHEQLKEILDSSERRVLAASSRGTNIFNSLDREYLERDNYTVIYLRGNVSVIVVN